RLLPGLLGQGERVYTTAGGKIWLDVHQGPWVRKLALDVFEPETVAAMKDFLRPGGTFVDVGAHVGYFTLLGARLVSNTGCVVAVEPDAGNAESLRRNLALNDYTHVRIEQVALGRETGTAELFIAADSGQHSLLARSDQSVKVDVRTLDDLWSSNEAPPIDVIKIDVEGAELDMLRGARDTLRRSADIVVLMDVHPRLGVVPGEVLAELAEVGLQAYHVRPPYRTPVTAERCPLRLVAMRPDRRRD
ncbi:MAG: FkbM family methyltransferase, partial [Planctomycetales bacterium]|nr:FkbM family methyltransferase [Planctomycetales bacterium]